MIASARVAASVLLLVGGAALAETPTERVARDVRELVARRYPRATHVDPPTPGRFGDRLAAPLAALGALDADAPTRPILPTACTMDATSNAAPSVACRALLDRALPAVEAVLAATHATEAGLPPGMGVFRGAEVPVEQDRWRAVLRAAQLAQIQTSALRASGHPEQAAAMCVDTFALARDASFGAGMLGASLAMKMLDEATRHCGQQLAAAPAAVRGTVVAALTAVRRELLPLARAMREEATRLGLGRFGMLCNDAQRAALPPEAQAELADVPRSASPEERRYLTGALAEESVYLDALVAAIDLPPALRHAQMERAGDRLEASPHMHIAGPNYERYAERRDTTLAAFDALLDSLRRQR